jgi:hypothetical protein
MAKMGKFLSLCLAAILAVSSLLMVNPSNAQSIPKPSVPQFSLDFSSQYNAVIVTIRNQVFNQSNGNLYYNVRLKEHNSADWIYPLDQLFYAYHDYPMQSTDSDFTNVSITVQSGFLTVGSQNDIEVEAMLGNIGRNADSVPAPWAFTGQTSDWSTTQTQTIPSTNPSPTTPEFPIAISLVAVLSAVSLLLIIGKKKLTVKHIL